jgi:hypothetical protein
VNRKQRNHVTMFKTVGAYLDEHSSIWSGMAPLEMAFSRFKAKIGAIDLAVRKQETPTGARAKKAAARAVLEGVLFSICEGLAVLGHTGNDLKLLARSVMRRSTCSGSSAKGFQFVPPTYSLKRPRGRRIWRRWA